MSDSVVRVATALWPVDSHADWDTYADKVGLCVAEAADNGARLIVLPEFAAMELASLLGDTISVDAKAQLEPLAEMAEDVAELHAGLARTHRCHILAGSMVERDARGRFVNRARLFGPFGGVGWQDRLMLTMWERTHWTISPGEPALTLFDLGFARAGVLVGYDVEFPAAARALALAGANLLLVPSRADSLAGYWRMRIGTQARTLENQCFAVQAATTGEARWSGVIDENTGAAGVFAPPDLGMPADGVVELGAHDMPGWIYADLDFYALARLRRTGAVRGPEHWDEQPAGVTPMIRQVR